MWAARHHAGRPLHPPTRWPAGPPTALTLCKPHPRPQKTSPSGASWASWPWATASCRWRAAASSAPKTWGACCCCTRATATGRAWTRWPRWRVRLVGAVCAPARAVLGVVLGRAVASVAAAATACLAALPVPALPARAHLALLPAPLPAPLQRRRASRTLHLSATSCAAASTRAWTCCSPAAACQRQPSLRAPTRPRASPRRVLLCVSGGGGGGLPACTRGRVVGAVAVAGRRGRQRAALPTHTLHPCTLLRRAHLTSRSPPHHLHPCCAVQVVQLWQADLAKINPKAAESLANPQVCVRQAGGRVCGWVGGPQGCGGPGQPQVSAGGGACSSAPTSSHRVFHTPPHTSTTGVPQPLPWH